VTGPSGLLIVDKPSGMTSHDVVVRVRRRVRGARVGHAGTLDPAATGVLLVLLGKATKLAETLMDERKEYEARIRLGRETDTGDATGRVLREHAGAMPSREALERALDAFRGEIDQVPPMVSALKVGGKRLYTLARAGTSVPRAPRRVRIDALELRAFEPPLAALRVVCGRGTYLRAIATDLGERLGTGGMLDALRRTAIGPFCADRATPVEELEGLLRSGAWRERLIAPSEALAHLPGVVVSEAHAPRLLHGESTAWDEVVSYPAGLRAGVALRVLDPAGRLLATARALVESERSLSPHGDAIPFRIERVLGEPGAV
jgi:tRNA pseudouridine55 synthase